MICAGNVKVRKISSATIILMDQTNPDFVLPLSYIFIPIVLSSFFSYWLGTKIERFFFRRTGHRLVATIAAVLLYMNVFPFCTLVIFSVMQGLVSVGDDSPDILLGVWILTLTAGKYIVPIFLLIWGTFIVALMTRPFMIQYDNEIIAPKRGAFAIAIIALILLSVTAVLSSFLAFILS